MTTYKPGTVAMVKLKNECAAQRAWLDADGCWQFADGYAAHSTRNDLVADVRPLVVLDPRGLGPVAVDYPQAFRDTADLLSAGMVDGSSWTGMASILRNLADEFAAQTRPTKPEEPRGIGAVVEDADGDCWVRDRADLPGYLGVLWLNAKTQAHRRYSEIAAVRVLSEGVAQP